MKKTILLVSLFYFSINTQAWAQSTTESKHSNRLVNNTVPEVLPTAQQGINAKQKKTLTPEDYKLWSSLYGEKISDNGGWYAYTLIRGHRLHRTDTLFVGATQKDINYTFPAGTSYQFSTGSKWFGCLVPKKGMALLNLEKDSLQWISHIDQFEFSMDGQYLVGLGKLTGAQKEVSSLWILDLVRGRKESISGVREFLLNPTSNSLAYIVDTEREKAVIRRQLEGSSITSTPIIENALHSYKGLVWNNEGTYLAFLQELPKGTEKQKRHRIYYYADKWDRPKLQSLDPTKDATLFPGIDITGFYPRLSEDGSAVFFYVQHQKDLEKAAGNPLADEAQIWNTKNKRIYPREEIERGGEYGPKLAAWWPRKDNTLLLGTNKLPEYALTGDRKHLLSYNPLEYAPHFKSDGDINLYLTDLETGQYSPFLRQQENGHTLVSPSGRYINYFRNKHWWVYDLKKKTHNNVTESLGIPLYELENAYSGALQPYGCPGWTQGDKEMVVYDQYDVWLVSPTGKVPRRLTRGRESQIRYRLDINAHRDGYGNNWFPEFEGEEFNLSDGLAFKTLGKDMASGYSLWKPGKQPEELVYKDMYINRLKKARNKEAYIYIEQSFDTSPRLRYWEQGMSDSSILVETNPQQEQFLWGRSELVRYQGPDGKQLQGALFYPANYTPGKKYPMIVQIYEIMSKYLHHYINPMEYLQDGFNLTNYTAEGYLVFYPDIKYQFNDPGISAVHCIEAGVKAVLAKEIVERQHIGLIGHSFGGYEATFVITQTDLFTTAVAGAGVTDLVSFYHSVGWDKGMDQMWRFENHQWRFKDSFYQNPEAYLRNSPIHHAANINTSLLLWTGKKDYWLDWQQSIELYLSLRRLDKYCELLIYPEEGHSVLNPKSQVDLTRRIKKWFDTHLKEEIKGEETE